MKVLSTIAVCASSANAFEWTWPKVSDEPIYPPNGYNMPTNGPVDNSTYEYIVVGSGPGGSPLAARLALAGHSVLLIDAGEDRGTDRQVQVPALHPYASEYNPIRWDFFVDHYADEEQAKRDSKMSYLTPSGEYYSGLNPPEGSVRKGVLYPRTAFKDLIPLDGKFDRVWPPPEMTSEEDLKQFIKDEAWGHHASCTAPIGADDDPMAVLDSEFRVRGVHGLRVVDASIFPKIPGMYIALPIYMVSEKAAEVIINSAASS